MTRNATDIALRMERINGLHVFRARRVASQAAVVDFFGRMILENENLCGVAAARDVLCAWTMAAFAPLACSPAFRIQRRFPVRRLFPLIVDIFMAGFAGFGTNVIRGLGCRCGGCTRGLGWSGFAFLGPSWAAGEYRYGERHGSQKNVANR